MFEYANDDMTSPLAIRFRALADPTRLLLLGVLLDEELTVGELAEVSRTRQPSVSRHLAGLRDAGLIVSRRQGAMTFYRANAQEVLVTGALRAEILSLVQNPTIAGRIESVLERRRARADEFFDERAEGWDGLRAQLLSDSAVFASFLPLIPRGLTVVDIGTGTGGLLPHLAEFSDRIVGIDQSAQMLRRARDRARRLGLTNVEFHRADISKLPLPSNTFDVAFAVLVLHHAPKPLVAMREMARVVKPGGRVIVLDLVAHGQEWLRREQADLWLGFTAEEVKAMMDGASLHLGGRRVISRAKSPRSEESLELFVAWATKQQEQTALSKRGRGDIDHGQ
ncbi:MAG: Ubiquinone/menaquinone biosynthesis C-methyltransferase UbiE [Deltaproteobacteria bacterium ADurb.Bin207]|jgi:ArsR family transcriptional regulator|nr:MAG: Ubiquinone/menaquinone biosynthesis C-methyltransferase UbiE [Deltaproteobacteria bacterium ADurb.Bin207]